MVKVQRNWVSLTWWLWRCAVVSELAARWYQMMRLVLWSPTPPQRYYPQLPANKTQSRPYQIKMLNFSDKLPQETCFITPFHSLEALPLLWPHSPHSRNSWMTNGNKAGCPDHTSWSASQSWTSQGRGTLHRLEEGGGVRRLGKKPEQGGVRAEVHDGPAYV